MMSLARVGRLHYICAFTNAVPGFGGVVRGESRDEVSSNYLKENCLISIYGEI